MDNSVHSVDKGHTITIKSTTCFKRQLDVYEKYPLHIWLVYRSDKYLAKISKVLLSNIDLLVSRVTY